MSTARFRANTDLTSTFQFRVELGDVFLFLYFLGFVRQYFWVISHNRIAWTLSALVTAPLWYLYVSSKQFNARKLDRSFWLVVAVPLLLAYLMRAAFPDRSFDVLNYHLLHSERTLRGSLFGTDDFFPSGAPFNPIADTLTGISRLFLGFRLGTIINLLALLWAGQIVEKLLKPFIERAWLRSACVLLVLLSEHLLFEISTYMVDLLALPLLLQATLLTVEAEEAENRRANLVHIMVLLGASAAFKFTNLAVVLPIFGICAYRLAISSRRSEPKWLLTTALLSLVAFVMPLLPFTVYMYRLTGNPVFPIANGLFNSPYWPTHGGWDNRWGPIGLWETIVWPIMIWFKPERYSELAVYSGRLSLGVVVAFTALILARRTPRLRTLCIILLVSTLLWSAVSLGYSRYGLYQDLLAGIVVVVIAGRLMTLNKSRLLSLQTVVALILFCVLGVQAFLALSYTLHKEWGGRISALENSDIYSQEAQLALRDHFLGSYLNPEERALFDSVQVWFETCPKTSGFEVLLNSRAPIIAARQPEYFLTRDSRRQFTQRVQAHDGQRMYSLCLNADLPTAKQSIAERGLQIGQIRRIDLPFFSPRDRIGMMLIEVSIPQDTELRNQFESSWMKGAFATSDYREEITASNPPSVLHAGERTEIRLRVKNLGSATWPSVGTKDFRYQINMGDRWIINDTISEDNRAVMGADLPPGAEIEIKLTINAPATPGDYTLQIDMVHEGVTWFSERGAKPLVLRVRVQP
jgi:Ig-like domain from next to BRCA1 gene